MQSTPALKETDFYNTKTLATLLDVTPDWLVHNRQSNNPIPYKKIGRRLIRYYKHDVLAWIGRKDLALVFFSTASLAKKLNVSIDWLKQNRSSDNPVPFRKFGRLVRYQRDEVAHWLQKNNLNT